MCRHIGYIGKNQSIDSSFIDKSHSLIKMAYAPKEMKEAILNADGFGFGWLNKGSFYLYKCPLPIWNDMNLAAVTKNIKSNLMIGSVRSATLIDNLSRNHTHPFIYSKYLFSHNGYIKDFNVLFKKKLANKLDKKFLYLMRSFTDSEFLFYLLMQLIEKERDIVFAIKKLIEIIKRDCETAMLNFLLANYDENKKSMLFATRVGINVEPPSLYYLNDTIHKSIYVSSEKLDKNTWVAFKENTLLKCEENNINFEYKLNKL